MTELELQRFTEAFERALKTGKARIEPPLPRRVRARLWVNSRIDHAGCWLVDHGHDTAAQRLWRACGKW